MMGASLFSSTALSYLLIWGLIGCVFFFVLVFDTFFIDGFTLAVWRPKFLKIPDEMGRE